MALVLAVNLPDPQSPAVEAGNWSVNGRLRILAVAPRVDQQSESRMRVVKQSLRSADGKDRW